MSTAINQPPDLFGTVVDSGCCIGCGACAAFDPRIRIQMDGHGRRVASRGSADVAAVPAAARVCPFADGVPNEDELARGTFGGAGTFEPHLGYHLANYAGWVNESDYRARGSSGGLATWLLVELMKQGLVDHVVQVAPESAPTPGNPLFKFVISSSPEEVRARSKSRYYPVEMSGVLGEILQTPGRYAVVGIPCFIKAIRLAMRESPTLRERISFTVGIVCGHLKSSAFADLFAWQCGITPGHLRAIDFRTKRPVGAASDYAVTVTGERDGQPVSVTRPTSELYGSNWGHGFFKYKACEFCDDVIGETADISIGDAWLGEYVGEPAGTNVAVVRSAILNTLLTDAVAAGRLHMDSIAAAKVVESQAGGFRHRRDGLAYRLLLEDQAGRWRPTKRVMPAQNHLSPRLRRIHASRYHLGQASHAAFATAVAAGDFNVFKQAMDPLLAGYESLYRRSLPVRILGRIMRMVFSVLPPRQ